MRLLIALTFAFHAFAVDREPDKAAPKKANVPPRWTVEKLDLGEAFRAQSFEAKIPADSATDEEGNAISFKLVPGSGPKWLKVAADGTVTGTPTAADRGNQTWQVQARDKQTGGEVPLLVNVGNRAPKWNSANLSLPDTIEEKKVAFDLAPLAQDPDRDALTFAKVDGPLWMEISPKGKVSAAPPEGSFGKVEARVEASDGDKKETVTLTLKVAQKNYAPTIAAGTAWTAKEREPFTADLAPRATDRNEGDKLTFSIKTPKPWYSVTPAGMFTAKPTHSEIGSHTFTFTVSDGTSSSDGILTLVVERNPRPPAWTEVPVWKTKSREPFKGSVSRFAKDLDGRAVTFSKKRGAEWLAVSPSGDLAGTPADGNVGESEFTIAAANDVLAAEQAVRFQIEKKNYVPELVHALEVTAKERETTTTSVPQSGSLKDADEEALTYSATKLPAWASLTPTGELTVKPSYAHIGKHSFTLAAKDRESAVNLPVNVTVVRNPRPPIWTAEASPFKTKTREPFKAAIGKFAKDADGLAVSFTKKSGPAWITVSATGELSGTPTDADAGPSEVVVSAANDAAAADHSFQLQIEKKNYVPTLTKPLEIAARERETSTVSVSQSGSVQDPDGDALTFSAAKLPAWITLSPAGEMSLKPLFAQIGAHKFTLTARDRESAVEVPVTVTVARNPRPPTWSAVGPFPMKTREPFKASVAASAKDADGLAVKFSKTQGPLWLSVSPTGELTGTPTDADAGNSTVEITAANDVQGAAASVQLQIVKKNYPPTLVAAFEAKVKERETTPLDLRASVNDPDGEKLTFTAAKAPSWVTLAPTGEWSASPLFAHIGTHKFTVQAKDREATVELPVTLIVERNPRPPVWAATAPASYSLMTREPFKASVAAQAKDSDGLAIKFAKTVGPEWLNVAPTGELSGTPKDADAGNVAVTLTASNDKASASHNLTLQITKKNNPPTIAKAFEATVKERETATLSLSKSSSVVDIDGDSLTYAFTKAPPSWVTITPDGELTARPMFPHIGVHKFSVQVKDREASVDLPIALTVARNARGPEWSPEPLQFTMQTREPFKASLAGRAKDLDGRPFTYAKVSGPEWLKVSPTGEVSGEPTDAQAGSFSLIVQADNKEVATPATVAIRVNVKNHPPVVQGPWLFQCKERTACRITLGDPQYVKDVDGDRLAFTLKEKPTWLSVSPDGAMEVQGAFGQIGKHAFNVEISDGPTKVPSTMQVTIERDPRPPVWSEAPLTISGKAREALKGTLTADVKDLDGLPLKFTKTSGPEWVTVATSGTVTASPTDAHVGKHTVGVEAANDLKSARREFTVEVLYKNHPPTWTKQQLQLGSVRAGENLFGTVRGLASDIDPGAKITYEKKSGPSWVIVAPDGMVFGKPPAKDVGNVQIVVRALDAERESADITASVRVDRELARPQPSENPIRIPTCYPGELFAYSFSKAFGANPYSYRMVHAPAWIKLIPSGEISGIPQVAEDYEIQFEVITPRGEKFPFKALGKVALKVARQPLPGAAKRKPASR